MVSGKRRSLLPSSERIAFERSALAKGFSRLSCAVRGEHTPLRGQNGWENFGSGVFCAICGKQLPASSLKT